MVIATASPLLTNVSVTVTTIPLFGVQLSKIAGNCIEYDAKHDVANVFIVTSTGHTTIGAKVSLTVTVAPQVDELPLTSVTVKTTGFVTSTASAQSNDDGETVTVAIPQASFDPLFM
jgi:hypothetical protein